MEVARSKKADILQHCIYKIATGKWSPGIKLPSLREAEKIWGVNRLTVLSAYRELEQIGLAKSRDRSGYYVSDNTGNQDQISQLSVLYEKVKKMISKSTDAHLSYVFKYFESLAVSETKDHPNFAFLECTESQAADHANEIFQRLNVYVEPVCLKDNGSTPEMPSSIKTLLTTGFHLKEVNELGRLTNKPVHLIPIEIDPAVLNRTHIEVNKALIVELEDEMSTGIKHDLQVLNPEINIEHKLIRNIESNLLTLLDDSQYQLILLSPRIWGRAPLSVRRDKKIRLIRFKISNHSWQNVAKALQVPIQVR